MLGGKQSLQRRLDRVFCRLQHWRISSTKLLGREALPPDPALGPLLFNNKYPVFPSDHFGLLLTLTSA